MTPGQIEQFRKFGYLLIPGALDCKVAGLIRGRVLEDLKRLDIWAGGRSQSRKFKDMPIFQQTGRLSQLLRYPDLHEILTNPDYLGDLRTLAGGRLTAAVDAQLLVSLPHGKPWTLQALNWHRDVARSQLGAIPGVQAFFILDDLMHGGGGTLALAGSQHLKEPGRAITQAGQLDTGSIGKPWIVNDTELQLVEMTGRAGDVYLMDMRVLHTPAVNASRKLRIMATTRHYRE